MFSQKTEINNSDNKSNNNSYDKLIQINTFEGSIKQKEQRAKYLNTLLDEKLSRFVESRIKNDFKKGLKL